MLQKVRTKLMKKILSIVINILFATCTVVADTNDTNITLEQNVDSISTEIHNDMFDGLEAHSFVLSILSSMLAAIGTLFLFFTLLRPRLKIQPILAFYDFEDKNSKKVTRKCEMLIQNKNLFACNDVRVEIFIHLLSMFEDEERKKISQQHYLTIAGRLRNENASSLLVEFDVESIDHDGKILFPKRILIEILSQHSLSGVIVPIQKIFTTNDMHEGRYIKSIFTEKGKTYKQAVMKTNICTLKRTLFVSILAWIFVSSLMFIFLPVSWILKVYSVLLVLILIILGIIIWQLRVCSNANAFNNNIRHIIKNTIIEFHQHKNHPEESSEPADSIAIEDIPYEETINKEH